MRKAWKIAGLTALCIFVFGAVFFGLSLVMGGDLIRIADAVFPRYDFGAMYLYYENIVHQICAFLQSLAA